MSRFFSFCRERERLNIRRMSWEKSWISSSQRKKSRMSRASSISVTIPLANCDDTREMKFACKLRKRTKMSMVYASPSRGEATSWATR